jgi:hypothetical protein
MIGSRSDQFWFGLVLAKKNNQTEIFLKKTETGRFTGSNRPVRFCFLDKNRFKPVWLGFPVWLDFSRFGSVFLFWLGFAWFFSGLARVFSGFGSVFRFQTYKTEPVGFFNISIRFFSRFEFFYYFFPRFFYSLLIGSVYCGFLYYI